MRSLLALALVAFAAGCTASTAEDAEKTNGAITTETPATDPKVDPNAELSAHLKAAYEQAGAPGNASILSDVKDVDWMDLAGEMRRAFNEYAGTASGGGIALVGGPVAQVGTFEGHTIYFVAGDLSDTGSEWGFYAENGDTLAVAYGGQGENPGAGGVDWGK